jgi:HAMP domain-containing protein
MSRSIRWRITLAFAAIIALVVLALGVYLAGWARANIIQDLTADPNVQAQLLTRLRRVILFSIVIAAVIGGFAANFLARRFLGPLRELTEATRRIAGGETPGDPFPSGRDEVGDLLRSLNQMS